MIWIGNSHRRCLSTAMNCGEFEENYRAMNEDEVQKMLQGVPREKGSRFTFRLGDTVRIKSGPFTAFTGKVEGINQSKALLKVTVNIFGRQQPVQLRFLDVERISFTDE
jgi:transcription antitermination factor NusG